MKIRIDPSRASMFVDAKPRPVLGTERQKWSWWVGVWGRKRPPATHHGGDLSMVGLKHTSCWHWHGTVRVT
jgi:hypothetical protein